MMSISHIINLTLGTVNDLPQVTRLVGHRARICIGLSGVSSCRLLTVLCRSNVDTEQIRFSISYVIGNSSECVFKVTTFLCKDLFVT